MKLQPTICSYARLELITIGLALSLAIHASPQAVPHNTNQLFEPRPGNGGTQAFGIPGTATESLFAQISSAPPRAGEYLHLHGLINTPTNANWSNAVVRLADTGDGFTLIAFENVKRGELSPEAARLIEAASARINERLKREGTNPAPAVLTGRLERAALADITCHSLETSLVPWTLKSVRPHMKRAEVRTALEKLSARQLPEKEEASMEAAYRDRLAIYAKRLLSTE